MMKKHSVIHQGPPKRTLEGLCKDDMQDRVKDRADILMKLALSIGEGPSLGTGRKLITDGSVIDPEDIADDQVSVGHVSEGDHGDAVVS
jgi:hypothetical protein